MNRRTVRRGIAALVLMLALTNVWLAAAREPLLSFGPAHIHGVAIRGSRFLLLFASIAMLGSVGGLSRGKRAAWLVAVAALCASLIAHPLKRADIAGVGLTAVALASLLLTAGYFSARSDPVRARQGAAWLILGFAGVFTYGVLGIYFLDRDFRHSPDFLEAVENGFRLLFILPATTIDPASRHGHWFIESVRIMALVVLAVGLWLLVRPVIDRATTLRTERALVRQLLERYATSGIAYFHLLDDKRYFFSEAGDAFIGYRVVAGTAVALGEPVGAEAAVPVVARQFGSYCEMNGWRIAFHQVTGPGADTLRAVGFKALKIGEEAIVPVQEFSLDGKAFKHVRNACNRLSRDGCIIEQLSKPIGDDVLDELREVSDAWLADGGHRERSFSLGAFGRDYLQETDVFVARSSGGRIEAFVNALPPLASKNGNFDLMRRRPDSPDGVMDYLFVYLIDLFRSEGLEGMNLGFAPLARIDEGGLGGRSVRLVRELGGSAFNFEGLRAFKDKWNPRWEPRFLVYENDLDLPSLLLSVVRAGERSWALPIRLPRFAGRRLEKWR